MRPIEEEKKGDVEHKDTLATIHAANHSVLIPEDDDVEECMDFFNLFTILHGGM